MALFYGVGTNKDGKAVRVDIEATNKLQAQQEATQTCKAFDVKLEFVMPVKHTLKQGSTMQKGAKERFRKNKQSMSW